MAAIRTLIAVSTLVFRLTHYPQRVGIIQQHNRVSIRKAAIFTKIEISSQLHDGLLAIFIRLRAYLLRFLAAMKKTKLLSELRVSLEQELRENGYTKTGKIEICCDGNTFVIRGKAKSYYQKQMAFNIAKRIGQGVEIKDDLTVD